MIFSKDRNVYIFFFLIYLVSLTSNFSAAHDSIDYLIGFEQVEDLLQPHHLLYHVTTFAIFKLSKIILPFVANHYLIEVVNAFWGAGAILVVNLILRKRLLLNPTTAFLGTCLPAFSFGIWFYSANIEVYMPSLFFMLLLLYKLTSANFNSKTMTMVILLHALAILFHQINVIFTPVILWKIWQKRNEIPFVKSLLAYSLCGGGFVIALYLIVGWGVLGHHDPKDFNTWIRGYTMQTSYWFPLSVKTAGNAAVGFGHALIGAHFVFRVAFIEKYLNLKFYYHSLSDESFLVRNISHAQALFLLILSAILFSFLLISFIKTIRFAKKIYSGRTQVIAPLIFTFLIYTAFILFWMPENLEFWFLQLVIFWILIIAGITSTTTTGKMVNNLWIASMALMLITINYLGSIRLLQNLDNDYYFAKIKIAKEQANAKDLVILKDPWIVKSYLIRYSAAPTIMIPERDSVMERSKVDNQINSTLGTGNRIFLYTDASFKHAVKNQPFIDSLLKANAGKVDTINSKIANLKIIHQ